MKAKDFPTLPGEGQPLRCEKFRVRPSESDEIDFHDRGFIKMIILIYEALLKDLNILPIPESH